MAVGKNIKAYAQQIREKADRAVRVSVAESSDLLVSGTPVDVGTARSSWMGRIGSEPSGRRKAFRPYEKLYSKHKTLDAGRGDEDSNLSGALDPLLAQIQRWRPSNGKSFYIANDRGYISKLSDFRGYSLQPPTLREYYWLRRVSTTATRTFNREMKKFNA